MAKDRKKLLHIHSSVPDKQPTAASLEVGEIAVNNAKDQEFLSLKNSDNKVVRFSSDEQIVTIMEKKEVMPYKGYVRGETGPSSTAGDAPTADTYGSYGITENDLLTNKSNIIVKLNQVAAGNTIKHDKVNGAKDKYNKEVNPTDDGGLTDGAGFFIDMSRYAMQDANPQFSSTTNTCKTTLSGTTIIRGLDGSCGSLLDAKVATEIGDFGTATNRIGTATTLISGDTSLTVSGNTTETHNGPVVITNNNNKVETIKGSATANTSGNSVVNVGGNYSGATSGTTTEIKIGNVAEYHSGTTTETKKENVTENNLANKTENTTGVNTVNNINNYIVNTSGDTHITTTGNTAIHSDGNVGISAKGELSAISTESDMIITANDDICETAGNKATFYGANQTNVGLNCNDNASATTTNVYGFNLNTSASTASTRIISANTTIGSVNTTVSYANTNITSADTVFGTVNTTATTETLSGDSLTITENTTDITSCGHLYLKTDDFKLEQCNGDGSAEFKFCDGFKVDSNDITLEECAAGGSILIKETTSEISGTTLTVNEDDVTFNVADDTIINTGDDLTINTTGDTTITTTGETKVTSTGKICVTSSADANFGGDTNTRIGANCEGTSGFSNNTYISASNTVNVNAPTINVSGNTTNISGTSNVNVVCNDICISGGTEASMGAQSVKIGTNCGGTTIATGITAISSTEISLSSQTINNSGTTNNNTFNTINNTATTENNNITNVNTTATNINTTANTEVHNTTSFTVNSTSEACIVSADKAGIGGNITTNIGTDCEGTAISNTTNIYGDIIVESGTTNNNTFTTINTTANTINQSGDTYNVTGDTNITGDTYITGTITIGTQCNQLTSTTIDGSFCEVFNRGKVTMTRVDDPADTRLSAIYRLWQDDAQIGYDINVPKDGFLKNVELVDVSGTYNLRFTWWIYDADTATYRTGTTDVSVEDLVKEIEANNTQADRGVCVNVWYNETTKKMNVSADTTVVIKNADGTGTKTFSKANCTHTLNSYTLNSTSGDVKSTAANTNWTYDPFVEKKDIVVPTDASHINRKTVSWSYGDVCDATGGTYDPGDGTVNTTSSSRTMEFIIPKTISDVTCGDIVDNSPGTTGASASCVEIKKPICVTGTITASGAIYSSDRNLKENINFITGDKIAKAGLIHFKSFNFKDDVDKRQTYGVIAQEIEELGLNELVHQKEDGNLGVDYVSLLILKNAYLENMYSKLSVKFSELEAKLKELENRE